jgi:FkbM family methyltransferase
VPDNAASPLLGPPVAIRQSATGAIFRFDGLGSGRRVYLRKKHANPLRKGGIEIMNTSSRLRLAGLLQAAASRLPRGIKEPIKAALLRLALDAGIDFAKLAKDSGIDLSTMLEITSLDGFTIAYRQGTADQAVLQESFHDDIFFSGVPEYMPQDTDVVIDVGAHIGTFALIAASKVPHGGVYAIEACKDNFNLLRINVGLNNAANVSVHHLAVSDKRGTCTLYHAAGNWSHSVVHRFSGRGEEVDCCTLRQFLDETGISRCDFIKFNCEGAEFPILLTSSTDVLERIRMMLVLYHCDLWKTNSAEDLISHLEASGFECQVRYRSEQRGWIVATNQRQNSSEPGQTRK